MNELDLGRGLRRLSAAPHVDRPIDEAEVARRVRRGRARRASRIAAACVAVVLGLGSAVWALGPFDVDPVPPAETTDPVPEDATTPKPEPTPDAEGPEPDQHAPDQHAPEQPERPDVLPLVAVDQDSALVLLDPATGAVLRTVAEGFGQVRGNSTLDVDRRSGTVELTLEDADDSSRDVRISLEDGTVEDLPDGRRHATASHDGRMTAHRDSDPDAFEREEPYLGYRIRDLGTAAERWVVDPRACECGEMTSLAWSPGASHLAVLTGYADVFLSTRDLAVLPSDADSWADATVLEPQPLDAEGERWRAWTGVTYLAADRIAVLEYEERREWAPDDDSGVADEVLATAHVVELDPRDGAELRRTPVTGLDAIGWDLAPAPDGDGLVTRTHEWGEQPSTSLVRIHDDGTTEVVVGGLRAVAW